MSAYTTNIQIGNSSLENHIQRNNLHVTKPFVLKAGDVPYNVVSKEVAFP
jgi:hypothetical protein